MSPSGFTSNAELGKVVQGCGHGGDAEFQFLAGAGNREDWLPLEQAMDAQGRTGGFANLLNPLLIRRGELQQGLRGLSSLIGGFLHAGKEENFNSLLNN